jgi:hypothetical protein
MNSRTHVTEGPVRFGTIYAIGERSAFRACFAWGALE